VVFYSRCGSTEKLALAAAVRAVQKRANIRLRRLPDVTESSDCKEETARMKKEYVPPAEADIVWAESISFHLPARMDRAAPECASFLSLVENLKAEGKFSPP
jgi:NAD(P)H dehydrogenase (quinone)